MLAPAQLLLAFGAGVVGGAMNALAGGGTFATMPTLIALGLPSTMANATSNVALQPGAAASAWAYRHGLAPLAGVSIRALTGVTFAGALGGSLLLVLTPTRTFDVIIPWLLLVAFVAIALGRAASEALRRRFTVGPRTLVSAQALLGVYGGYFGGGIGMMMTALFGLLTGAAPHDVAAPRTLSLATANGAATIVFAALGMIGWAACLPMIAGGLVGGYLGARLGLILPPGVIRGWTVLITGVTTIVFFIRAYA